MTDHTSTSLIPHLCWRNASEAVEFYHSALGVETLGVFRSPDGRVMHANLRWMASRSSAFGQRRYPGHLSLLTSLHHGGQGGARASGSALEA